MLTWLFALPLVLSVVLASLALKVDVVLTTLEDMGLGDLEQALCVTSDFREAVAGVMETVYGLEHAGKIFLNYTTILYELDAVVQGIAEKASLVEAEAILGGSRRFQCLRRILEAEFSVCLDYVEGLPRFSPKHALLDILYDEKKVSALPYLLDHADHSFYWVHCIQGLAELGRSDLLELVTFSDIWEEEFRKLLGIPLPEFIVRHGAKVFCASEPDQALSRLLAFAVLDREGASILDGPVPLFALPYLQKRAQLSCKVGY